VGERRRRWGRRSRAAEGLYLDTCIIIGLVKEDLGAEMASLYRLLNLRKAGAVDLVTSHVAREEIQAVHESVRARHEAPYGLLEDVPSAAEVRPDSGLSATGVGGGSRPDPLFLRLCELLPDRNDARHIFQAIRSDVTYFVTTDQRTVLSRAEDLEREAGVRAVRPSQLVATLEPHRPDQ
jgi:hypothetical protein